MPRFFQEKFQVDATKPPANEVPDKWVPWSNDRTAPALGAARRSQEDVPSFVPANSADMDMNRFNVMPPGMDIEQPSAQINHMPLSMAGETDVSKDTNDTAFREGYKVAPMKSTDEMYTEEHIDLFYDDAGGFCERHNMLDRL